MDIQYLVHLQYLDKNADPCKLIYHLKRYNDQDILSATYETILFDYKGHMGNRGLTVLGPDHPRSLFHDP